MIPVESLIDKIQTYNPKTDVDLIKRAYAFGLKMHEDGALTRNQTISSFVKCHRV